MSEKKDLLPDCRTRRQETFIQSKIGTWVPIFCGNCGLPGGAVPEKTFAFWLCNGCYEKHGAIAFTMAMPDEVFWAELAAEQEAKRQKEGN